MGRYADRMKMSRQEHWENIYSTKADAEVSWTLPDPHTSLTLIREACPSGHVIDVGGGTSVLVDRLLETGYNVAVLDISEAAIDRCRKRLGTHSDQVRWVVGDVTAIPDVGTFDVWHDRAVFHFLTGYADRRAYVKLLTRTLRSGGHAVIATFALDGPQECSGLTVCRYDGQTLAAELRTAFSLIRSVSETHVTPWGKPQSFQYSLFRRN